MGKSAEEMAEELSRRRAAREGGDVAIADEPEADAEAAARANRDVMARQQRMIESRRAQQVPAAQQRRPEPEPVREPEPAREPSAQPHHPRREEPRREVRAPIAEPEPPKEEPIEKRIVSRETLLSRYWLWMGFVGALCFVNSVGTTIVFTQWLAHIMFPTVPTLVHTITGVTVAFGLFIGQLMNSTYVVLDEDGNKVLLKNRRTAYRFLLAPDVFMTIWFWFPAALRPIYNGLAFLLAGAWLNFSSLYIAAVLVVIFGVFSAQFPEKAATDPRLALGEHGKNLLEALKRNKDANR